MNRLLESKVAVVTGSSRGLGLAVARALSADGAKVLVVSRSGAAARKAATGIEERSGVATFWVGDLTEATAADSVIAHAVSSFGGVDILVNSAGLFVWKPFMEFSLEDWRRVLDTNLTAAFLLIRSAARVMIDQGRGGSVVNITSVHGSVGDPNVVAQCASKSGLVGLTRAAAEALRPFDIRVNAVSPGSIDPDSADRSGESPNARVTQADIATLVVYLSSDLARSITGSVIEAFGSTRTQIKI